MNLENLLEYWAAWCERCEDNGVGYASSRLNRLMAGCELAPRSDFDTMLPYGVDGDAVATTLDREICRLTIKQRQVVFLSYRRIGTQAAKAKGLGISQPRFANTLREAKIRLNMQLPIKRLLNIC